MSVPVELHYTPQHEWLKVEGDEATIGITAHAAGELGDVVFVSLPEPGTPFARGAEFGSIESVKAVEGVFMPVSGEIVAVNEALAEAPEKVNEDPWGEGWIIRIRITEPDQIGELLGAAAYSQLIQ
jgi:glycine cleavage system H protein